MLKINKGKVPKEFYEAKRLYKNYDELDSTEKEKLKDILIPEQNNRCAYSLQTAKLPTEGTRQVLWTLAYQQTD